MEVEQESSKHTTTTETKVEIDKSLEAPLLSHTQTHTHIDAHTPIAQIAFVVIFAAPTSGTFAATSLILRCRHW